MKSSYGLIGLGAMGSGMAKNILEKANPGVFTILDTSTRNVQAFLKAHQQTADKNGVQIKVASTPAEVAASDIVISMLPTPQIVEDVLVKADGSVLSKSRKGQVVIDCSTIDPATAKRCGQAFSQHGVISADAPVSGGQGGAQAGTLTFMVGTEQYDKVKQALSPMGSNFFHCGTFGNGQAAKICNNMMLGISMLATSETLNLGAKLGIKPEVLSEIMNVSSGQSWSLSKYNPHPGILKTAPSSNSYKPGFGIKLMEKDMKLAVESGKDVPLFLGSVSYELYKQVAQQLKDPLQADFSIVYKWLQDQK